MRGSYVTYRAVSPVDRPSRQRRDVRGKPNQCLIVGSCRMLAVVTLNDGSIQSKPIPSTNEGLAEAVNYLVLKRLAFGTIATYEIQTLDGEVYFTV